MCTETPGLVQVQVALAQLRSLVGDLQQVLRQIEEQLGGPAGGDRPGISVTRLGPGHPAAGAE